MCDPEITDKQARDGLRANMVDYDPHCGQSPEELLLNYCRGGLIKDHVTIVPVISQTPDIAPVFSEPPYFVKEPFIQL